MDKQQIKAKRRIRRRAAIRHRVSGTTVRPRLCVYRSLNHFYAQVIDDLAGRTLASASTVDTAGEGKGAAKVATGKTGNATAAAEVGSRLAAKATAAGVRAVVFDRGGFKYHGRVKAFADAARKGGLEF